MPQRNGAVIYTRVSTIEQAREGISLAAQLEQAQHYAAFKRLNVFHHIEDVGISGSTPLGERPGGRRLLDMVRLPEVSAVIAFKLDRVFRDAADCLYVTKQWDKVDVDLHLVDIGGQPIDTSTAMGRFFLTVMAGVAEMERNLIVERTKAALQHLKDNNKRVGAVPYGWELHEDGVSLLKNKHEQKVIRTARKLRKQGLSFRAIATQLKEEGYTSRTGQLFYAPQISRMMPKKKS